MQNEIVTLTAKIKTSLEQQIAKNPSYSLRAYAKRLGVSAATLSGVLNGQRKLTPKMAGKIGFALGLSPSEVWDQQKKILGYKEDSQHQHFHELSEDVFIVVSEWYHLAILEVMKLRDFEPTVKWVSQRLKVHSHHIKMALERLQRVGILEIDSKGKWVDKMSGFTTHYQKDKTTEAKRRYQKQLLEKSIESLQMDDFSVRDHSSTTMAIDVNDIPIAKEEIKKFRRRFSGILEHTKKQNEVYQLQISFYPITKRGKK